MTTSNTPPRMRMRIDGDLQVRVVSNLLCPHCGRELRPIDVRYCDETGTALICEGCHNDVVTIVTSGDEATS